MTYNLYWKDGRGKLHQSRAVADNHFNAIAAVVEALLEDKEQFNYPVLALIKGGSNA